jgi:hypothetical protein
MPWEPGKSGNPAGYKGGLDRKNREVFQQAKDPIPTLFEVQHNAKDDSVRVAAASAVANYAHPKLQSIPTPRYIENQIELEDPQTIGPASPR